MSQTARLLFDLACKTQSASDAAWHTSTETHSLLTAAEEASGICYWVLRTAMSERIANNLLRRLHDIASRDLGQHESAQQFVVRKSAKTRYGTSETRTEEISLGRPMLNIVERHLDQIAYRDLPDFEAKRAMFLDALRKSMPEIDAVYTEECVESLNRLLRETDEAAHAAKGGVA